MEHHIHQFIDQGDTTNHYVDGHLASIGIKGLFGSKTFFDSHNHPIGHTEPNPMGGKATFDAHNHLIGHTEPNSTGGKAIFDSHNHLIGHTQANSQGGHDVWHGSHLAASTQDIGHGFSTVMSFADPLLHIGEYSMPSLHF